MWRHSLSVTTHWLIIFIEIIITIFIIIVIKTRMVILIIIRITSCYLGMTSWITVGGVGGRRVFVPDRPTQLRRYNRLVPTTKTQPRLNSHQIRSGRERNDWPTCQNLIWNIFCSIRLNVCNVLVIPENETQSRLNWGMGLDVVWFTKSLSPIQIGVSRKLVCIIFKAEAFTS